MDLMNEKFWDGFLHGLGAFALILVVLSWVLPEPKSRVFVVKYCVEKQVKEACEILGEEYGK